MTVPVTTATGPDWVSWFWGQTDGGRLPAGTREALYFIDFRFRLTTIMSAGIAEGRQLYRFRDDAFAAWGQELRGHLRYWSAQPGYVPYLHPPTPDELAFFGSDYPGRFAPDYYLPTDMALAVVALPDPTDAERDFKTLRITAAIPASRLRVTSMTLGESQLLGESGAFMNTPWTW